MKVRALLAETAAAHQDGTVSILRAGITRVWGEKPPVHLQGCLVVRIEGDLTDKGSHQFDVRCMDEDGAEVMPKLSGQFAVPQGGAVQNLLLVFGTQFERLGTYVFTVRIDNAEQDRWSIKVVQRGVDAKQKGAS